METIQKEKVKLTAKVVSQEALTDDICSMWIQADEIAKAAKPGQFCVIDVVEESFNIEVYYVIHMLYLRAQ